jgi:hypothetical protein
MPRKIARPQTLVDALMKKFNKGNNSIHCLVRTGENYVTISAEDNDYIDGFPVADYYDAAYMDPKEEKHIFGINRVLYDWLAERGWSCEWETPGSVSVYRD